MPLILLWLIKVKFFLVRVKEWEWWGKTIKWRSENNSSYLFSADSVSGTMLSSLIMLFHLLFTWTFGGRHFPFYRWNLRLKEVKQIVQFHRTSRSGSWTYVLKYLKISETVIAPVKICAIIWAYGLRRKGTKLKKWICFFREWYSLYKSWVNHIDKNFLYLLVVSGIHKVLNKYKDLIYQDFLKRNTIPK